MRTKTFNELSFADKKVLTDDFATKLISIEYYDYRIHLYALNQLLIEERVRIDTKTIETIETIGYDDLDKFTMRITLPYMKFNRSEIRKKDSENPFAL